MEAMDTSNLDDLLHKAEQLTAIIDGNVDMPRIERNIRQLLDAGDQMYNRTAASTTKDLNEVRASVLLGSKGFDLQKVTQKLDSLSQVKKAPIQIEATSEADIKGFLKKECEHAILKNIETVRQDTIKSSDEFYHSYIEKEWEEQKNRILNAMVGPDEIKDITLEIPVKPNLTSITPPQNRSRLYFDKTFIDKSSITSMNASEMSFTKEVIKYVDQLVNTTIKGNLTTSFSKVARDIIGENSIIDLWTMVATIISDDVPHVTETDPLARRSNFKLNNYFIAQACTYLEDRFVQTMQSMVNAPIGQNVASDEVIYNLVKDYLHIKTPCYYSSEMYSTIGSMSASKDQGEDGKVEGIAVWCFIFYCLRAGSIGAAIMVAQKMANQTLKNEITKILGEYKRSNDGYLSRKTEEQLKLNYHKSIRLSNDIFKKSVYSIFARCAHAEFYSDVFDKVDDFLWIKLKKVSLCDLEQTSSADHSLSLAAAATPDQLPLGKFKKEILDELGEAYFDAQEQPFLYFRALFLTLQWEAAIEFLFRFEPYRCYALHIALALHEHRLIILSQHVKLSILSRQPNDPPEVQRLNLTKLISIYTKKFEQTNTSDVVYYYYFLPDWSSQASASLSSSTLSSSAAAESTLFNAYVSQLVRETKKYDLLLGYINDDGVRMPGAIDKFNYDTAVIITQVAIDLENEGFFEDAVKLYDLAGNHTKVLVLLNKMLSPLVAHQKNSDEKRRNIEDFAIKIADR